MHFYEYPVTYISPYATPQNQPPTPPPPRKPKSGLSLFGEIVILLVFLGLVSPILCLAEYLLPGPLTETKTVIITHGMSARDIAGTLGSNGVIRFPILFRAMAKLTAGGILKAGEYEFTAYQSMADIMLMIHEGHSVVHLFTVAEGLTAAEVLTLLRNNPAMSGDIAIPAEGSLLPETYRYSYADGRAVMVMRMQKAMQDLLTELWPQRDPAIPLTTPQQAVILASIVEKETGKVAERPRIAEVFYNRLRDNMKLQSDPTVIYAITLANGPLNRELAHEDLAYPSPYNTYIIDGLPPGPICNPGRAALEAVLHPEQHDYLYFVADGTGGHVFAHDLATHNQNVTKWNAVKSNSH